MRALALDVNSNSMIELSCVRNAAETSQFTAEKCVSHGTEHARAFAAVNS